MNRISVNPKLLRWARKRSGHHIDELAGRFPKIEEWECGKTHPTLKQLEDFARRTYTPIGFFFLTEPPVEDVPIPDFRTIANEFLSHPSANLLDTVYLCQQRQDWYHDFAQSIHEPALKFVGSARLSDDVVETATRMRSALMLDLQERRRLGTWTDALRRFIKQADALGILVMVSGIVGNNTQRRLDPQEFRGFALADPLAPLVFVNGADTQAAQMFTLAHELAHIWLGKSGVSDAKAKTVPGQETEKTERWCNQVAAELLVPLNALRGEMDAEADMRDEAKRLARHFKVSTLVILRRIHDAGQLSHDDLWAIYHTELNRLLSVAKKSGGGNFHRTLAARVGQRFARELVVSTLEGRTAFTEAFRMLDLTKVTTFKEFASDLGVSH